MTLLQEIRAKCSPELLATRDSVAIAAKVNEGRKRLVPTEIGVGTVLETLGEGAGEWLDALTQVGAVNRDVHWALKLIDRGVLRIDLPATRTRMQALAVAVPALASGVTALLTLGFADDPVDELDIRRACWSDSGDWLP